MNAPDDYEELDYMPRVHLREPIISLGGSAGWDILLQMFNEPFTPYLPEYSMKPYAIFGRWSINVLVWFIFDGVIEIASTHDGYTLTADGRFYVAEYLTLQARWAKEPRNRGRFDERDIGLYDGMTDEAEEYMLMVQETY